MGIFKLFLGLAAIFLISDCSKKTNTSFDIGLALEQNGKYEAAIKEYEKALKADPQNAKIHLRMALSYSSLNNFGKAEEHYQECLKLDDKNLEAHLNYSGFLFKHKNFDQAEKELAWVINAAPGSNEALLAKDLIVRVENSKIRNTLIERLESDLHQNASDEETKKKLAKVYAEEGDELLARKQIDEAKAFYAKAVELTPQNGEVHFLHAQFSNKIGDKDKVVAELELANELDPKNLRYKISLAGFYTQINRQKEGQALLQKVIELDPKSEEAEFARRRLEEMEASKAEEEKKQAEEKKTG